MDMKLNSEKGEHKKEVNDVIIVLTMLKCHFLRFRHLHCIAVVGANDGSVNSCTKALFTLYTV